MNGNGWPSWAAAFLEALLKFPEKRGRVSPGRAADMANISRQMAYKFRDQNDEFRAEWDKIALLCLKSDERRRLNRVKNFPVDQ